MIAKVTFSLTISSLKFNTKKLLHLDIFKKTYFNYEEKPPQGLSGARRGKKFSYFYWCQNVPKNYSHPSNDCPDFF
jgi:hypothetical protein